MKTNLKITLFALLTTLLNSPLLNAGILYDAVETGNLDTVKQVFKQNPNINTIEDMNELGWTPLHLAATFPNADIFIFLIEQGANTKKTCYRRMTPFDLAMMCATIAPVQYWVEHDINDTCLKNLQSLIDRIKSTYDSHQKVKNYLIHVKNYFDNCTIVTEKTIGNNGQPIDPETIPNYELLSALIKKNTHALKSFYKNDRVTKLNNTHFLYCLPQNMEN